MTGAESHPALSGIVEGILKSAAMPANLRLAATLNEYVGDISDHGVFRRNDVPYLFFSCGRWPHYHQPTDTPDVLNFEKAARITRFVWNLLPLLAGADLSNPGATDTTDFEIRTLETALGEFYRPVLAATGGDSLRTREDLRRFVEGLLQAGL